MARAPRQRARSDAERQLVLQVISLLRRVGAATQEWQRTEMEEGFTVNQALVLHHLASHGDATPSDLAAWMHVSRGSVTPTVKRLEDLGLLSRRADEQDARKQWLSATAEGREIAGDLDARIIHPILAVFSGWTAADLQRLSADLTRVLATPPYGGKA